MLAVFLTILKSPIVNPAWSFVVEMYEDERTIDLDPFIDVLTSSIKVIEQSIENVKLCFAITCHISREPENYRSDADPVAKAWSTDTNVCGNLTREIRIYPQSRPILGWDSVCVMQCSIACHASSQFITTAYWNELDGRQPMSTNGRSRIFIVSNVTSLLLALRSLPLKAYSQLISL